jgi:lipopolysaccharide export system protein LptA
MISSARWTELMWVVRVLLVSATTVGAQPAQPPGTSQGVANPLQGFSQNRDQPVKIDADSLEVRDKDKLATFLGNVHVVQGDTTMICQTLVVFYEQSAAPGTAAPAAVKPAPPGAGGQQQIRRLEAKGGVVVTQKDQTATGHSGVYDMKTNTVTLTGNVVVSQGQNIVRGDHLVVDLATGVSRVEAGKSTHGRVEGLFLPANRDQPGSPHEAKPAVSAGKDLPKPPSVPMRLN